MAKPKSGKVNRFNRLLLVSSVILLLIMIWLVFIARDMQFDQTVQSFISNLENNKVTPFMKGVSFLGNHNFLIPANILLIIFFLIQKRKLEGLTVFVVALSSLGLMSLLKRLFHRLRPADPMVEGITNFSFPSGHAFMSIALYGLLLYFLIQKIKPGCLRTILVSFLLFIIFIIGISRIYLRVHYPSDIIAGWTLGIIWLLIVVAVLKKAATKKATFYK